MLENFILGAIQGVAEWLPVSSEGLIFIVKNNFFNTGESIEEIARLALFLHFGTFLAALLYFRKDVLMLVSTLFNPRQAKKEEVRILVFLIGATVVSGLIGLGFYEAASEMEGRADSFVKYINLVIGCLLIVTAILQIRAHRGGDRKEKDLKNKDGLLLGVIQGFAVFPGLSRSGLTVSALLLSRFREETALRLSFLMSLPLVLIANIVLNMDKFTLNADSLIALLASFVFGYLTIGALLKMAKKINFGFFVLIFAVIMIVFSFI